MSDFSVSGLTPNIMVNSVNKSLEFYHKILQFNEVTKVPSKSDASVLNWAMLSSEDGAVLMLHRRDNFLEEYPELGDAKPGGSLVLYMRVSGVRALYRQILSKVTVIKKPHVTFYGMLEFAITDPDGYILTFSEQTSVK